LSADHDFVAEGHGAADVAGLACLGGLLVLAFILRNRHPLLALALAWPVIALLPTNSLLAKRDLVTEKPLYLAWVGPSIAVGGWVSALSAAATIPAARRFLTAATAAVLMVSAGACMWRAALWREPTLLWLDATAKSPDKSRCWNNLGMAQLISGREAEAYRAFQQAVRLDPANEIAATNLLTARILCGAACETRL
jgi:hypothetical protein